MASGKIQLLNNLNVYGGGLAASGVTIASGVSSKLTINGTNHDEFFLITQGKVVTINGCLNVSSTINQYTALLVIPDKFKASSNVSYGIAMNVAGTTAPLYFMTYNNVTLKALASRTNLTAGLWFIINLSYHI